MNRLHENKELVVLAYDWPDNQGGYRMSCKSCLLSYLRVFAKVRYVCIADRPFRDAERWSNSDVEWVHVPIVTRSLQARFISSLFSPLPAITMRYVQASRQVMRVLSNVVSDCRSRNRDMYVVLQSISMACFLHPIRKHLPGVRVAVSSHDLAVQAFERFSREGSILKKLAWKIEVAKIRSFEKRACLAADKFWTITDAEAKEYEKRLSVKADGVFYRGLDIERYVDVTSGDPKVVVHVGSADLRKGAGIIDFIEHVWLHVRAHVSDARLVLAGRFTERFTNAALGIEGMGFVEDDLEILGKGMIFLNPQRHGAGLQFKSIVAMLSGKALLTTSLGIEGIEGNDGEHYFVADTHEQMIARIVSLMNDATLAKHVGQAAQVLMTHFRKHEYAISKTVPLLEAFVNLKALS